MTKFYRINPNQYHLRGADALSQILGTEKTIFSSLPSASSILQEREV